jgi:FAD/FMN-containing dehydrogenase
MTMGLDLPESVSRAVVHGWAETAFSPAFVARADSVDACSQALDFCRAKRLSVIPRGGGYTFGDMITSQGNLLLDTKGMNAVLQWQPETGEMSVEPGVTIGQVLSLAMPAGWILPSCPGGKNVTMAGALGNDVHGKDSWHVGTFMECVKGIRLLLASGEEREVDRETDETLFRAVAGGMGLLGVVVRLDIQLLRPASVFVTETSIVSENIIQTVQLMEKAKAEADLLLAWVDAFATGSSVGRGYVSCGCWADTAPAWDQERMHISLSETNKVFGKIPAKPFWWFARPFFRPVGMRVANMLAYTLRKRKSVAPTAPALFSEHNFIHNKIPELIHVFRPYGLVEFQVMFPNSSAGETLTGFLELCQKLGMASLLGGTKAHRSGGGLLSFAGDGYSFSVDLQLRGRRKAEVVSNALLLFDYVVKNAGKLFLAKDSCLTREHFRAMYPGHTEFMQIKQTVDKECLFVSDMYHRLLA